MTVLTDAQVIGYAKAAGFKGSNAVIADAIAHAESGMRTDARNTSNSNGTQDLGLMQINTSHAQLLASGDWRNPTDNMRMAYSVYQSQGWHAWSTYNVGAHLPFMAQALAASGAPASTTVDAGLPLPGIPGLSIPTPGIPDLGGITGFGKFATDGSTYLRAAEFFAGLALLFIGIFGLERITHIAKTTAKGAILI